MQFDTGSDKTTALGFIDGTLDTGRVVNVAKMDRSLDNLLHCAFQVSDRGGDPPCRLVSDLHGSSFLH
jgi:hypothetical protein